METLAPYAVAMISLLVFVLIVLLQSALVGAGKAKAGLVPGADPDPDYNNAMYRMDRAHQNGVEILPAAATALFASVMLGVSAGWVNLLMALFLVFRILYILVYSKNMGKPSQGTRTMVYVASWAMIVALCVLAIVSLL